MSALDELSAEECRQGLECVRRAFQERLLPTPTVSPLRTEASLLERVLARAARAENGCLEWQGATSGTGYGRIKHKGRLHSPHRVVLEATQGLLTGGLIACHSCDNPRCVEPTHLFAGTYSDNNIDAIRKGRMRCPHNSASIAASNRRRRARLYRGEKREMRESGVEP